MNTVRNKVDPEWEAKELLRLQELEEARNRATQMEKTMRWWSDCTANWREKWSKVRNERNKARDEVKLLQVKLDLLIKESSMQRSEKRNLEVQNEQMQRELEQIHMLLIKHVGHWDDRLLETTLNCPENKSNSSLPGIKTNTAELANNTNDSGIEEYVLHGSVPKHAVEMFREEFPDKDNAETLSNVSDLSICYSHSSELLKCNLAALQIKLDEAVRSIVIEREEKLNILKSLEIVESELASIKEKCENLKMSKQEAMRELSHFKDIRNDAIAAMHTDFITTVRKDMNKRLADVRSQLENLQAENAVEWGKRERMETEKLLLERENKKLRAEIKDMSERMERRSKLHPAVNSELHALQLELLNTNKELNEAKQIHAKLKKSLSDKSTELNHTSKRVEQYETEVKKLRSRIEELKRELVLAEDEIDYSNNNIRKLQRSNDDLQEQIDNLQAQIQHLNIRMRMSTNNAVIQIGKSIDEYSGEDS